MQKLQSRALVVGLLLVTLLPLALVVTPPLNDYPSHLARAYVLANLPSSPALQEFYRAAWAFQPNLAFDVVVIGLQKLVDIDTAGRIFVGLTIGLTIAGVAAVHRVSHDRASLWPLLAIFFAYSRIFFSGIVGYLFTLGLGLVFFAAWILLRRRNTPPAACLAVGTVFAITLYFGHMTALGVYALLIAGFEIDSFFRDRAGRSLLSRFIRLAVPALQFLPPAAILFGLSATTGEPTSSRYGDLVQKLTAPMNLLYNYSLPFDVATAVILGLLLLLGLWAGVLRWSPRLILPALILAFAYLATPNVLFDSHGADRRLTIAVAQIAICALDWRPEAIKWRTAIVSGLIALFLVRMGVIAYQWRHAAVIYAQYEAAFARMPPASRLAVAIANPSHETKSHPLIPHIASLAIIRRDAFVHTMFTNPAQQPIAFAPAYKALAAQRAPSYFERGALAALRNPANAQRLNPFRPESLAGYDYLLVIREDAFPVPVPSGLATVASGEGFRLLALPH